MRASRLPRRAKIWRRPRNFEIALSAEKKELLNHIACARAVKKRFASCNRWKTMTSNENHSLFRTCSQGVNSAGRILAAALERRQQLVSSVFTFCVHPNPDTSRLD